MSPVIPPEVPYTDAERRFINNQPPGLWPENQDSIFGQFRKVLCDEIQVIRDQIDLLAQERYIPTALTYLSLWEEMLGAAISPTGKSMAQRRAVLLARLKYGAFTRAQRDSIIEEFVKTTFGQTAALTELGIPLLAGGVPLYGPIAPVTSLYRVYEVHEDYAYDVWIKNTNTPDIGALTRELTRMTPAGISFAIDNTRANILDYYRGVYTDGPTAFWRLTSNFNDDTPNALNLTPNGGVIAGSGATLVQNGDAFSTDFDGIDDYLSRAAHTLLEPLYGMTIEAWVRVDTSGIRRIVKKGTSYDLWINDSNRIRFELNLNGTLFGLMSAISVATATTYHVVATWDGKTMQLYVNGVLDTKVTVSLSNAITYAGDIFQISDPTDRWDGRIDEVAFYTYPLSTAEILRHYNTGINVA